MPDKLDTKEVIKTNPGIDGRQLEDVVEALKLLRSSGISRPAYNIMPPFSRRPARQPEQDPRAVHIRR
jgi:hypothetical protein